MRHLPTIHDYIVRDSESLHTSPYIYAQTALEQAYASPDTGTGGIEDLLAMKKELAEEIAAMVVSNLGLVDRVYQVNVEAIELDIIEVDNMIRRLPFDKKYYWARERLGLEKEKLELSKQLREQRTTKNQHSAMLLKELREAAMTIIKEQKKGRLLSLDEAVGDDEG